jgi:hypothetical protein
MRPILKIPFALYFKTASALYHYDFHLRKGKESLSTTIDRQLIFRVPRQRTKINDPEGIGILHTAVDTVANTRVLSARDNPPHQIAGAFQKLR